MAETCLHCGYAHLRPNSRYCPQCGRAQIVLARPVNVPTGSATGITPGGQPAAATPANSPALLGTNSQRYLLQAGAINTIGRQGCTIDLNDPSVAPRAASLIPNANGFAIRNTSSSPLTVNGAPVIFDTPLGDGDIVTIGAMQLRYVHPATGRANVQPPAAPPTPAMPPRAPASAPPPLTVSVPPAAPSPGPATPSPAQPIPSNRATPPPQPPPSLAAPMVVALPQVYPTVPTGGYNRLERLLLQGEGQAMDEQMRARFLEQLRTEIFRFRQTAQSVLELANTQPRLAAAAMSILFRQLERSGIRPEQFPDLNDKEYIATTFRTVERSRNDLLATIPSQNMQEIRDLAEMAAPLPELAYYVNHFDEVWEYRRLVPEYERTQKTVQGLQRSGCLLGGGLFVMVPLFGMAALGLIGLIAVFIMEPSPMALLGLLAVAVPVLAVFVNVQRYRHSKQSSTEMAERIIAIAASVDLAYFAELERRYGPDKDSVQRRLGDTAQHIQRFFGPYASLFVPE